MSAFGKMHAFFGVYQRHFVEVTFFVDPKGLNVQEYFFDLPASLYVAEMGFGKNPSVLVSNSESVSGSVSHVGIFVLTSAVTEADAVLADELPALVLATVVNV